jgi:calcium binding protein 39
MVAQYLEANFDRMFTMYNSLILSNNYVTKRQSLKLLGEILLDRANYAVMTQYISHESNLKMMMNFLRDKSRNVQFEAFHVFKVSQLPGPCVPELISRCLWRILISLLRLLRFYDVTRINYWRS